MLGFQNQNGEVIFSSLLKWLKIRDGLRFTFEGDNQLSVASVPPLNYNLMVKQANFELNICSQPSNPWIFAVLGVIFLGPASAF
ncbi:MAG: hypothetical protein R2830_13700 [Saprospiraceae bacterium]